MGASNNSTPLPTTHPPSRIEASNTMRRSSVGRKASQNRNPAYPSKTSPMARRTKEEGTPSRSANGSAQTSEIRPLLREKRPLPPSARRSKSGEDETEV